MMNLRPLQNYSLKMTINFTREHYTIHMNVLQTYLTDDT